MDVWYWRYELQPRTRLNVKTGDAPRQGALLRVEAGFADLHPWPELGDAPLDRQLEMLSRGERTAMTRASLRNAEIDAAAREKGASLFEGVSIPPSHLTVPDLASLRVDPSFDIIKVKMGRDLNTEIKLLKQFLTHFTGKVRVDFNESAEESSIRKLLDEVPRDRIDFLEDPMPYHAERWGSLSRKYGVRLAADRPDLEQLRQGVAVVVFKPALGEEQSVVSAAERLGAEVIITSNMDHPVGQMAAAAFAARLASKVGVCGLITHTLYAPNPFSERMRHHGPRLEPTDGTGVGFDDLLEKLPWKRLK